MAVESCSLPFFFTAALRPPVLVSPVLHFAPGCRPLCDGSSDSGKRSTGIPAWHTGPSGAKKHEVWLLQGHRERVTFLRNHPMSVFTRVLTGCLAVCVESDSHYQPLSGLSAAPTRTATAATDISARWVELFASLLNVRKYQAVSTVFCQFGHLARPFFFVRVFLFVIAVVLSHRVFISKQFKVLVFLVAYNHITENYFLPSPSTHTAEQQTYCRFEV